jgi:hypothetical protein
LVILFVLRDYVACEGIPWKMIQMFSLLWLGLKHSESFCLRSTNNIPTVSFQTVWSGIWWLDFSKDFSSLKCHPVYVPIPWLDSISRPVTPESSFLRSLHRCELTPTKRLGANWDGRKSFVGTKISLDANFALKNSPQSPRWLAEIRYVYLQLDLAARADFSKKWDDVRHTEASFDWQFVRSVTAFQKMWWRASHWSVIWLFDNSFVASQLHNYAFVVFVK